MLNYDVHAEAQARFTAATSGVSSRQTTVNNVLKGVDIGEILVDGIQTRDFLRKGSCRELDPIAKPFVHYTPLAVVATAAVSYGIVHIRPSRLGNIALAVLGLGEGLNVWHNHTEGCE
jgi:hypothetical protein